MASTPSCSDMELDLDGLAAVSVTAHHSRPDSLTALHQSGSRPDGAHCDAPHAALQSKQLARGASAPPEPPSPTTPAASRTQGKRSRFGPLPCSGEGGGRGPGGSSEGGCGDFGEGCGGLGVGGSAGGGKGLHGKYSTSTDPSDLGSRVEVRAGLPSGGARLEHGLRREMHACALDGGARVNHEGGAEYTERGAAWRLGLGLGRLSELKTEFVPDFVPEEKEAGADRYTIGSDGRVLTQGDFLASAKLSRQARSQARLRSHGGMALSF